MCLLQFLHPARHRLLIFHWKFFISELYNTWSSDSALLLLVFCDICSSLSLSFVSLSLSFESLDSILISNFHYYFQDGRPTRYYNHRYYKPYNIYHYKFITEEHGKTIDIIFIDAKQYDGRKDR